VEQKRSKGPAKKGVYLLLVHLASQAELRIGPLGAKRLPQGLYAYVGSAQSGLEARIRRHLSANKKMFWHVDRFLKLPQAEVVAVHYRETDRKSIECSTARLLAAHHEPVAGFGSSDCRCRAHLFRISEEDDRVLDLLPGAWEVFRI
jgi:Uri superfamily endonuclease